MLRFLLILLIVANAGLFAFSMRSAPQSAPVAPSYNESSVAIVPASERLPVKPKRKAIEDTGASGGGCYEFGPFQNPQAATARARLRNGNLPYREETQITQASSWMVATGYFPTRLEAERKMMALVTRNIPGSSELSAIGSNSAFMVLLGVYPTEIAALNRRHDLVIQNVENVMILPSGETGSVFYFERITANDWRALRQISSEYSKEAFRAVACE